MQVVLTPFHLFLQHKKDATFIKSLADSLLASISEITVSLVCIQIEQENFLEIGCYLYRASIAIMELKKSENSPPNAMEILQSLSENIDLAKDPMDRCQKGTHPISNSELRSIMVELEKVIKHMGELLSLIPSSTFKDHEYAEVAVHSLSKEMKNVSFVIQASQNKDLDTQTLCLEEQPKQELTQTEIDLYSIKVETSTENPDLLDPRYHVKSSSGSRSSSSSSGSLKLGDMSRSLTALPQVAQFIEPLYETFFCPLTKDIMDEPVTIESGVTYEKKAITEWFEKYGNTDEIFCPVTSQKLVTRVCNLNIALKCTIEEWKERNEVARIKVARAALSLASSEKMVLEAIRDVQSICHRRPRNKLHVHGAGMLPLIIKSMELEARNVRLATLELLRQLAEDDDDSKVLAFYISIFYGKRR